MSPNCKFRVWSVVDNLSRNLRLYINNVSIDLNIHFIRVYLSYIDFNKTWPRLYSIDQARISISNYCYKLPKALTSRAEWFDMRIGSGSLSGNQVRHRLAINQYILASWEFVAINLQLIPKDRFCRTLLRKVSWRKLVKVLWDRYIWTLTTRFYSQG